MLDSFCVGSELPLGFDKLEALVQEILQVAHHQLKGFIRRLESPQLLVNVVLKGEPLVNVELLALSVFSGSEYQLLH